MSHIVEIISERKEMQHVEYGIEFQAIGKEESCGYRFPCNKDGTLIHDENFNIWFQNYKYCLSQAQESQKLTSGGDSEQHDGRTLQKSLHQ